MSTVEIITITIAATFSCLALAQLGLSVLSMLRRLRAQEGFFQANNKIWEQQVAQAIAKRKNTESTSRTWKGFRKLEIVHKVMESVDACSFYLAPHDKHSLPSFYPGQYLTFRLNIPGQTKPTIRCYSLSDLPRKNYYRVTIKKVPSPPNEPEGTPGLSSSYFHDQLEVGDILDVQSPAGSFHVDVTEKKPVVMLAGGIGITPLISMTNALLAKNSSSEIWFFYGTRNSAEHIMQSHFTKLQQEYKNLNLFVIYSEPLAGDKQGSDYQHSGFINMDLLKGALPSNNYDYYMCGPPMMIQSLSAGLEEWNVPMHRIHYEAFGPASVKSKKERQSTIEKPTKEITVSFSRSGKTIPWDPKAETILEFAEQNNISMDSGCRAGNCGTCLTAIKKGKVSYISEPESQPEEGSCLTCISVPISDLQLDA